MPAELNVLKGPYLQDIFDQPEALIRTLNGIQEPSSELLGIARNVVERRYQRIILTGMGSSLFALYDLYFALLSSGLAAILLETSELVNSLHSTIDSHTLIIAVSQSGRSAELLRLLRMLSPGVTLIGVTNDLDSPLAAATKACVPIHAGPESTVSCKTYVSSLLALQVLHALLLGGGSEEACRSLASVPSAVRQYLSGWKEHVANLCDLLPGVRQIFVTGRGSSISTAETGGLILKESVRFPAEGMSSAAFRHGPFEMVSNEVLVAIIEGHDESGALNRRLASDIDAAGGRSALISSQTASGPFRIPDVPGGARRIVEILPIQMISLALAALLGREAGRFSLATKVTAVE